MSRKPNARSINWTVEEIEALVEAVTDHYEEIDLNSAKLKMSFANLACKKAREAVSDAVNAVNGGL